MTSYRRSRCNADRRFGPFRLQKVYFLIEKEAAVDLFAGVAERLSGLEAEFSEQPCEISLEGKAAGLWCQTAQVEQIRPQRLKLAPIMRGSRGLPAVGVVSQTLKQGQKPSFGIRNRIILLACGQIGRSMAPKRLQCPRGRLVVNPGQKCLQPFPF